MFSFPIWLAFASKLEDTGRKNKNIKPGNSLLPGVQVFTCSANRPPASVDYSESLRGYYFYFVQSFTSDKSQQDLFFYLGQVQKDLLKRSDYICTPPPAAFLLLFLPDQLEAPLLLGGEITQFKEKCIGSLQNGARTRIAKIVLF